MWFRLLGSAATSAAVIAETVTDPSSFTQYGIAGALMAFVLYLYLDERKEHKALRQKVLDDVLPALMANNGALLANNDQLRDAASAVVLIHQIAARPNLDPVKFAEWVRTMERTEQALGRVERKLNE